jgi:CRISPR-associated protein Cmr2
VAPHVLVMKLGPIQDFITQARRTRDLWYGSRLFCDLSREVARTVRQAGATLIFPHPEQLDRQDTGVANKVVALVEEAPGDAARRARQAAQEHLLRLGLGAFDKNPDLVELQTREVAREQLTTFLEFHAAWAPVQGGVDYATALDAAESALEARRALHAFSPWTQPPPADARKSSLDGGRPSVLRRGRRQGEAWRSYRIGPREELDALGLLKRTGGQPGQFVPVPTLGLAAWTQQAARRCPSELAALRRACEAHSFPPIAPRGLPWVDAFPFDGQLLLAERWQPYFEEHDIQDARRAAAVFGERYVRPLVRALGEPFPYVSCLVADGDHMGQTLHELARRGGTEAHRRLSHALSVFSGEARRIVEREHRGQLVYTGGDDVLAFVCPPDAPPCARALAEAFHRAVEPALEGTGVESPTLSVGLGMGHVMESLGELLNLGRRAERAAKAAGRDALALLVARHTGRERLWSAQWATAPLTRLEADLRLLEDRLPLGKVHEVEALLHHLPGPGEAADGPSWNRVLGLELHRILARAEAGLDTGKLQPEDVGLERFGESSYPEAHKRLGTWVSRVLVADTLARAQRGLTGGAV